MAECTIKIISGPEAGKEFTFAGGQTVIGRSPRCTVRLDAPSVSFEHALIVREADNFYLENLSANGTLLNREKVTGRARLRVKDQVQLGPETLVRVEKLPSVGGGSSNSRTWLLAVVVLLLIILLAVVAIDPLSSSSTSGNVSAAYAPLQTYLQQEADAGRLPAAAPALMREAWRLRVTGVYADSAAAWLRLHVMLDGTTASDADNSFEQLARKHPSALDKLAERGASALVGDDDQMRAALIEFVTRLERGRG